MTLTREQFLGARPALKREPVPVPELGEGAEVLVQEMTAAARAEYQALVYAIGQANAGEDGKPDPVCFIKSEHTINVRAVIASVVDEEGKALFTDEDVKALEQYPPSAVKRIAEVALRLSRLSEGAEKK